MDVLQEGVAVLCQAVDEGGGQGGGHLQKLIGVEERRHRRVQSATAKKQRRGSETATPTILNGDYARSTVQ